MAGREWRRQRLVWSAGLVRWVVVGAAAVFATAAGARPRSEASHEPPAERTERELPVPALFGRVSPSVVVIVATHGKEGSQGSGVVIGPAQIVTNYHVISGATVVEIRQGEHKWTATVEAIEPKRDLAILTARDFDLPRVSMRPSTALVVGQRVFAVGAPRGLELTLSDGLISALRHDRGEKGEKGEKAEKAAPPPEGAPALIQTTAPVSPGSSGGGLFDAQGRLVGITTFGAVGAQNLNFAHPTEWIEALRAPKLGASSGPDGGARGAPVPPPPRFTLTQRPRTLRCRIDTRAVWGLFTGGAEMLESKPVKMDLEIDRFQGQTPTFNGSFSGEMPFGDLVLADMSRDAGFVQFTGSEGSKGGSEYFFAMDDDGRFRLTLLKGFDFHGQVRVRASSGACEAVEPAKIKPVAAAGADSEERCGRGEIEACLAAGGAAEKNNRVSALSLYLKGCDQARAGDRVARKAAAVKSCGEAARVCDLLGYRPRSAELRARAARLQGPDVDVE